MPPCNRSSFKIATTPGSTTSRVSAPARSPSTCRACCAWLIEKLFTRQPGALTIHVDPTLGQLAMRWQPGVFDAVAFARQLQSFGYLVGLPGESTAPTSRALNLRLDLCAALAMNTMLFTLPRYLGMSSDFEFAPLFHRLTLLLIAALGFAGWWVATGALLPALQVLISVLVVSCPCASGVALPLASDLAASRLRRLGVFIRNSDLWAKLDRVRSVIFDKTGTLTLETISLRNPEVLRHLTDAGFSDLSG